jgi:hypothetical protein
MFASTFEEHTERLEEVISILHEAGLKIKFLKCQFGLTEIVYLGHLINEHGIRPDPKKGRSHPQHQRANKCNRSSQFYWSVFILQKIHSAIQQNRWSSSA